MKIVTTIFLAVSLVMAILGLIAIIDTIKKRHWGWFVWFSILEIGLLIPAVILYVNLKEERTHIVMMYIAVDADGVVSFFQERPVREGAYWYSDTTQIILGKGDIGGLTWQDEPKQVEIKIKNVNKKKDGTYDEATREEAL